MGYFWSGDDYARRQSCMQMGTGQSFAVSYCMLPMSHSINSVNQCLSSYHTQRLHLDPSSSPTDNHPPLPRSDNLAAPRHAIRLSRLYNSIRRRVSGRTAHFCRSEDVPSISLSDSSIDYCVHPPPLAVERGQATNNGAALTSRVRQSQPSETLSEILAVDRHPARPPSTIWTESWRLYASATPHRLFAHESESF